MLKFKLYFVLIGLFLTAIVQAEEGLYGGAGYDSVAMGQYVNFQNVHIIIGHGISDRLSLEGEANTTLIPYQIASGSSRRSDNLSLYMVARSKGDTFLKAKFGYSLIEYLVESSNVTTTHKSSGISYGIGVGLELKNGDTLEFDFTMLPKKIAGFSESINSYSSISYKVRY